ncbi:MAG: AMP-binding protein, partial [bacterium]
MTGINPLDKKIGAEWPRFASRADILAFEKTPYQERIAAASTYRALQLGAALNPERVAIHFLQRGDAREEPATVTFRQMMEAINRTANLLHHLGVGPGDVVSLLLPLLPQTVFLLFGAQAAGIVNPVNPLLEPGQIAGILRAAGTKVLVALGPTPGSDIWQKARQVRSLLPELEVVLQVAGTGEAGAGAEEALGYEAALEGHPADRLVGGRTIVPDDPAAFFHTGGTTGLPKLVRHSHANHIYQAWGLAVVYRSTAETSMLMGLPLFHVGGALSHTLASLAVGSPIVLLTPAGFRTQAVVRNYWKLVRRYRAGVASSVPTVLAGLLATPHEGADLTSLKYCSGGGSAIPVEVARGLQQKTGTPTLEVYGMTETSSVHCMSYPDMPIRLGSVGFPLPYSRVKTVRLDAEGRY